MSDPGKIYKAIPAIMGELGSVPKDGHNTHQNYHFQSIDSICGKLQPLLQKHGVFYVPTVIGEPKVSFQTSQKKGTTYVHVVLVVQYTFYADDGSRLDPPLTVVGEAMDYQDKAVNKAMAFAQKLALKQLFCIPPGIDGDADSPSAQPEAVSDPGGEARPRATREQKVAFANGVRALIEEAGGDPKQTYNVILAIVKAELSKITIDYADELAAIDAALPKYDITTGEVFPPDERT